MLMKWFRRYAPPSAKRALRPAYRRLQLACRGEWPYLVFYLKRRLTTRHPTTFTEKVRYKMIRDRRPLVTLFADKAGVRDYVVRVVGPNFVPKAFAIAHDPNKIDWDRIPREFACKASHGGGGSIIVWEGANPHKELPEHAAGAGWSMFVIHPKQADRERISRLCEHWLHQRYAWGIGSFYEWAYQNVRPRIVVEELLTESGGLPHDYRFFVFHGKSQIIQVETNFILDDVRRDFFRPDWTPIPVQSVYPRSAVLPEPPPNLQEMIATAEALGKETDFVRVDLYNIEGRILVGELTNYPVGGNAKFQPAEFDHELGRFWNVPKSYRSLPQMPGASRPT